MLGVCWQDGHGVPCPYWYFILAVQKVPVRVRRIRRGLGRFGLLARLNPFVYWHLTGYELQNWCSRNTSQRQ